MLSDISKCECPIEYLHYKTHKGELWFIAEVQTTGTVQKYTIQTGILPVHFFAQIETGAKVGIVIYRDVTGNTGGATVTPVNFNGMVATGPLSTFKKGATYAGGTIFKSTQAGFGTTPGQASSGNGDGASEYIFPPNSIWAIELTPSTSTDIVFNGYLYEMSLS